MLGLKRGPLTILAVILGAAGAHSAAEAQILPRTTVLMCW